MLHYWSPRGYGASSWLWGNVCIYPSRLSNHSQPMHFDGLLLELNYVQRSVFCLQDLLVLSPGMCVCKQRHILCLISKSYQTESYLSIILLWFLFQELGRMLLGCFHTSRQKANKHHSLQYPGIPFYFRTDHGYRAWLWKIWKQAYRSVRMNLTCVFV